MQMAQKFVVPLLWLLGTIIFCLSIAGIVSIPEVSVQSAEFKLLSDLFISILVLSLLMAVLALVNAWIQSKSGQNNYDVEQPGKAGAENKAFENEEAAAGQKGPGGKWTKNYVPFKGFPKGSADKQEQDINGVEVVNEVSEKSTEKKDAEKSGDEKWKKNYVPYQEPAEDSNKQ